MKDPGWDGSTLGYKKTEIASTLFLSKAEVVISSRPIDYPKAIKPDILLAMNQESCDAYFSDLKPEGLLVVDAVLVSQTPTSRAVAIPFTEIARKKTKMEMAGA